MNTPILLTNFKTYESATGDRAVALAKVHERVAHDTQKTVVVAVQATDIFRVSQAVDIPVFAQHCDAVGFGSHTGWLLPEAVKQAGASGTILNHSEHRFSSFDDLGNAIARAKSVGLMTCVCAEHPEEGARIAAHFSPDFIAVEPPELIGGDISVSTARPELISESVAQISVPVLVGAGVKTGDDVRIALERGAKGVLLASGITKSDNPEAALRDLCRGM